MDSDAIESEESSKEKALEEEVMAGPRDCLCGCGRQLPPLTGKVGRPLLFGTKTCQRITSKAKLLGWVEEMESTPRQYLAEAHVAKKAKKEKEEEDIDPSLLINPRICACGCQRPARFATKKCATIVWRREHPKPEAERNVSEPEPPF